MRLSLTAKPPKPKPKKAKKAPDTKVVTFGRGGRGNKVHKAKAATSPVTDAVSINSTTVMVNTPISPISTESGASRWSGSISKQSGGTGASSLPRDGEVEDTDERSEPLEIRETRPAQPQQRKRVHGGRGGGNFVSVPVDKVLQKEEYRRLQEIIQANPERDGGLSGSIGRGGLGNIEVGMAQLAAAIRNSEALAGPGPSTSLRRLPSRDFDFGRPLSPSMLDIVRTEPLDEEDESRFSGPSTTSVVTTSDRYDWGDEEEREPPCMRLVIATDRNTYMDASTIASTESLSAAGPEASSPGTSVSGLVTQNTTEFIEAPHECIPNPPAPVDNNADEPPPPSDISSRSRASSVSLHEVNLVHGVQVPMATALAHIVNARELLRPTTPLQPPDTPIHTGPPPSPGDQVEELPDLPDAPPQEPDDARVARPSSMHVYAGLGLWASLSVGLVASMI